MHLAERNLWRAMSKIVWGFNITPMTDPATGKAQPPDTTAFSVNGKKSAFAGGAVRVAFPFKVKITPRSAKHAEVIKKEFGEVLPILNRYN